MTFFALLFFSSLAFGQNVSLLWTAPNGKWTRCDRGFIQLPLPPDRLGRASSPAVFGVNVAFHVSSPTGSHSEVFIYNLVQGTFAKVSPTPPSRGRYEGSPQLTDRFVAYWVHDGSTDSLYLKDLANGKTRKVDQHTDGADGIALYKDPVRGTIMTWKKNDSLGGEVRWCYPEQAAGRGSCSDFLTTHDARKRQNPIEYVDSGIFTGVEGRPTGVITARDRMSLGEHLYKWKQGSYVALSSRPAFYSVGGQTGPIFVYRHQSSQAALGSSIRVGSTAFPLDLMHEDHKILSSSHPAVNQTRPRLSPAQFRGLLPVVWISRSQATSRLFLSAFPKPSHIPEGILLGSSFPITAGDVYGPIVVAEGAGRIHHCYLP